ncbi:MAG TPA: sulfite exporter TauE/SafE family protein, partial [Actinomycetes bacterium]|nr:sulfite exporter TauE/SafE family protein [Actinomycetes bacterium]
MTGDVTLLEGFLLVVAGFAAGLVGSVAGLASMVSYPSLLAVGLSPVAANVTNTVGITFAGVGSTLGSRPELVGQQPAL